MHLPSVKTTVSCQNTGHQLSASHLHYKCQCQSCAHLPSLAFHGIGSPAARSGASPSHVWVAKAGRRRHNLWSKSVYLNAAWVGRASSDTLGLSLNGQINLWPFKPIIMRLAQKESWSCPCAGTCSSLPF